MVNPDHIPHLLKLLDDDSLEIQEAVIRELYSFGPNLQQEVYKQSLALSSQQKKILEKIFWSIKTKDIKRRWSSWFTLTDKYVRLEKAITLVSEYLNEYRDILPLNVILDDLAAQYKERFIFVDARLLAKFLFKEKGLKGNDTDYYNPQNSNLFYVFAHKQGIPLSLSVIFMLVGRRLGLAVEGCNFPGHFLTRIDVKGRYLFIDCFSSGQFIEAKDILKARQDQGEGLDHVLYEDVDAETIIRRYLTNLVRAFEIKVKLIEDENGDKEIMQGHVDLMVDLLKAVDTYRSDLKIKNITPEQIVNEQISIFKPGDLIKHRKYRYRGIVVGVDSHCRASDHWYYGSSIQPEKYQPWVHILVDGSDQVTYVGESELIDEVSSEPIKHPLLTYFFTTTDGGEYIRNDNPWPETDF